MKTLNKPNAAYWLRLFLAHAQTYDYKAGAERAYKRREWVHDRAAFAK